MPQVNNDIHCTLGTCPLSFAPIHYDPSLFANLLFPTFFACMLVIHACQGWQHKTWSYSISIMIGLVLEIIGYIGRVQLHFNPFEANPFLIYLICLTIGPVFFSAAIYLTLSRVIVHYGVRYTWLTPKRISIIFMSSDFIALALQAAGGAIADTANTRTDSDTGVHIMVAGLAFQVLSLLGFMGVAAHYAILVVRLRKGKDIVVQNLRQYQKTLYLDSESRTRFNIYLIGLSFATIFILIRSLFRVAELWQGFDSKLANDETSFIILESTMMALAVGMLTFFHPGDIFHGEWENSGWGVAHSGKEERENVYVMKIERPASSVFEISSPVEMGEEMVVY